MMKKLFALLFFLSFAVFSQKNNKIDTIYVNSTATSYLIFDDAITLFNIGNNDFQAQTASTNTKILFVKAKVSNAKPTTLLLTHGNQIFQAYLHFREPISKAFYDYRAENQPIETIKVKDENSVIDEKFKKLLSANPNVSFKSSQSGMRLRCENLYNDSKGTFLKFSLANESSISYEIDNVSFSYQSILQNAERRPKSINRLQSLGIEEVNALKSIEPTKIIAAQKRGQFLYYIPLYATTEKGFLQVIFREKNGLRNVMINIPFKKILKAEMI